MSKAKKISPSKWPLTCDTCHGNQVIRSLLWCEDELEAAIFMKQSCHQFATVKSKHGVTALHVAAAKGWNKMCRWLLRNGADVDAIVKSSSLTPLKLAAMFGNIEIVILLFKAGGSCRETSTSSQNIFKYLYYNINSHPGAYNLQFPCAYKSEFVTFLSLAHLEQSIERVDIPTPRRRLKSTPTTMSQRQLRQKFVHFYPESWGDTSPDWDEEDNDEEIPGMVNICAVQKKKKKSLSNNGSFVYVFGLNQNYNLGLGTDDRRDRPTLLERFTREQSVTQVCLTKYHSLYLTVSGTVRACGHGVGGRLGIGTEDTCMRPEPVKLPPGTKVVMIAAGVDHSFFLTTAGEVYGCGLNTHHQLGLSTRASDKFVTPRKIAVSSAGTACPDLPFVVGVTSSDLHSVLWTKTDLYTWGTNVGQLGHADNVVHAPRAVTCCSALNSGVYKVCANNVCTVVATGDNTVIVLHYNKYSVVARNFDKVDKMLLSLNCFGGDLCKIKTLVSASTNSPYPLSHETEKLCEVVKEPSEVIPKLMEEEHFRDNILNDVYEDFHFATDDLVVTMVTTGNIVYVWSDKHRFLRTLTPFPALAGEETPIIVNIVATPSDILAVSDIGEVIKLELRSKRYRTKDLTYRYFPLAYLQRAKKIFCDSRGQNFAVLTHGSFPKFEIKQTGWESLVSDMQSLYRNTSEDESMCDVVLLCEGERLPVHKMIVAAKSLYFRELFASSITDDKISSKKDHRDGRDQKDAAPKVRCECSCCSESFQALSGFSSSDAMNLNKKEQSEVDIQKAAEISAELHVSFQDSSKCFTDFEAPALPTVDVNFIPLDVLEELIYFCYTGQCKMVLYSDFYFNSFAQRDRNSNTKFIGPARALKIAASRIKEDEDFEERLCKRPTEWDSQAAAEFEKYLACVLKGVRALKIQDFTENYKFPPELSLQRSLSIGLDVQFVAPDESLGPKAHRFILSLRVPFFNVLFSARWTQKSYSAEGLQLVRTPHCQSPAFLLLLQFCYTGSFCCCNLTLPLLQDLIVLADELLVTEARTLAEKHAVEFIDRRNLMSLYQFSVNFNCHFLRQHILFFAYFDTPFMLENRLMENLRAEDLQQISLMNKLRARDRMSNSYYLSDHSASVDPCQLAYYLPAESRESGPLSRNFSVSTVKNQKTENQSTALAIYGTLEINRDVSIEEDPMLYLRSQKPEIYIELTKHSEDMLVELESKEFKTPESEVQVPECPFTYHTHSMPRFSGEDSMSESDNDQNELPERGSWIRRSSGAGHMLYRRQDFSEEFSFDGLIDRMHDSDEGDQSGLGGRPDFQPQIVTPAISHDENPWHVVGRRYDEPFAKSLLKRSGRHPSFDDPLDNTQLSSRSSAVHTASDANKSKNSDHGNVLPSNKTTRRKTRRTRRSSSNNDSGPSDAYASSCDKPSSLDKKNSDDSLASELSGKASSGCNDPSLGSSSAVNHDGDSASDGTVSATQEDTVNLSSEFPSLAESAAAQQLLLLASKPAMSKMPSPFVRTSQKQRKKQMREQQEAAASVEAPASAAAPATPKIPTPAWGLASSSATSDEQPQEFEFPSLGSGRVRRTSQRTLSSSSGGSDFGVGSPQSASNFSAIMQREKTMRENYEKSQRKSLEHIQMEERAIAELENYYRALAGDTDTISVRRHCAPQSLPHWTEKHRPHDLT
ncbi:BTB/POZ domain [Trinorchestia longiramus]|nr:BTB/POZ domain [Trinorchestia longiramus]